MRPKILLVDDREDNLISMEAILASYDFQLVKANSGRQALKILLQEYDFALILMDVNMPNLNGFETATLIYERERLKQIPIIFITAHNYGEENIFKGYQTGAVDYIYKPVNPELLRAKVAVFVELYQKNRKLLAQEQKLIAINKSLENEIKEREMSEEKVRALNLEQLKNIDRLEAANKDLDRFAFMASHDLQEPLRKIRVFSDLLQNDPRNSLNEEGKKYVTRIQDAAEHMQGLIRDILMFSKATVDENTFVSCDLNTVVNEVWTQMENAVAAKKAKIIIGDLPTILANPGLIYPLFNNLIDNALKYSKKDVGPVIRVYSDSNQSLVGANGSSNDNYHCHIFVEDNGIGFDQQYAEQIFGMFKRLHHQSEYEGTGVGLALCKKIVELHHGFISVRSKVNEGSIFILSFPLVQNTSKQEIAESSHS
jgi:signal transduction histidine kinase